jgi:hypothetical protein
MKASTKELKEGFRCYPLAQANKPPKQKVYDLSGKQFNTIHANDEHYYEELNAVIQYEPADAFNPELVGLFASIGIKKGKPFAPDARMKKILKDAAAIGNATARSITFSPRSKAVYFYPDRQWYSSFAGGSHEFMNNGELVLDDRIMFHYAATGITPAMAMPKVGTGSAYAATPKDAKGQYLDGGNIAQCWRPTRNQPASTATIRPLNQTMMNLIRFGSGQRRQKGTRAIGFKLSPGKASLSYYGSMAHWSRGSTKPGNRVISSR